MTINPCRFCGTLPEASLRRGVAAAEFHFVRHDCLGPYHATAVDAATEWNAANAPADPAMLALARFGAYVVRDWFRRTRGFQAADGHQLDTGAKEMGVVTHGATVGFRCSPGIADAIARLLAPDGATTEEVIDG